MNVDDDVLLLATLPNSDLVSVTSDDTIKIWNPNDGTLKRTLNKHTYSVPPFFAGVHRQLFVHRLIYVKLVHNMKNKEHVKDLLQMQQHLYHVLV